VSTHNPSAQQSTESVRTPTAEPEHPTIRLDPCFRDEARRRVFFGTHFHDDRQCPRRSDTVAGTRNHRQKLKLKNLTTKEEIECVVVDVNSGHRDIPEVGVGFAEPCPYFWRVSFPPADCGSRNPEAKRLASSTGQPKPA